MGVQAFRDMRTYASDCLYEPEGGCVLFEGKKYLSIFLHYPDQYSDQYRVMLVGPDKPVLETNDFGTAMDKVAELVEIPNDRG